MALPPSRALRLPTLSILILALALALATPAAHAIEERAWVSVEANGGFYDPEQALKDNLGFGARAAGFVNRWVGIEALFHTASPKLEWPGTGDATFTHFGGGLIVTPDRYRWSLPYLYGGLGSASVDRGTGSKSQSAIHVGGGIIIRAGERLGFQIDGRNVSYAQEGGPGRDTRVNTFFISGGVTGFLFGRPRDTDEDGVPDKRDKSPNTPAGAVVDATGAPVDTDKDGVFDGLDKSPSTPGGAKVTPDGVAIDTDGDGVPDGIDQCDSTATGVIVDAKGCGVDTDGDKVFDGLDKCPDTPASAVVDAGGCPLDADADGSPDGIDICPYTPAGVAVNTGGCPIMITPYERLLVEDWLIRLTDLEFPPDSATLQPQAVAKLDSVGLALIQWPMIKIEIGAHVDDRPEPGYRVPLTQMRARAVLQHLFQKYPMLNQKNFWITGYGDTDPLVPNTSSGNRRLNRRVELKVMNMNDLQQERARRQSFGSAPTPPAPGLEPKMPGSSEGEAPPPQPPAPEGGATNSGEKPGGGP